MEDAAEIMEEFLGSDAVTDTGEAVGAYIYDASSEEEVSGKNGIESILSLLPPISFAIVGEPTNMHPAIPWLILF